MGIRQTIYMLLALCCMANGLRAQNTEEQRKYTVTSPDSLAFVLDSSKYLEGFSFHKHAEVVYQDLYFDTPEFALYTNNLSLRFRKRYLGDGQISYSLQLKSEIENDTARRMEADEPELDFYKVKDGDNWVSLTDVLDVLFKQNIDHGLITKNEKTLHAISLIQQWIAFKADGIVKPFQKLARLNLPGLHVENLKGLQPVIYGSDKRIRLSAYINPQHTSATLGAIPLNQAIIEDRPGLFNDNYQYNYVIECSLDDAVFYAFSDSVHGKITLEEFEIENKYKPVHTGTVLMSHLSDALLGLGGLQLQPDSKYRQCVLHFYPDK